ncbi:MAG: hypothetical protein KAS32_20070 [Candidatus Peribacteraceae bacterium]|nr:hypothetical protein [Candidatus Peribacteraceae bacterium]
MFPLLTFGLLICFAIAWMIFSAVHWEEKPIRAIAVWLAVMCIVLGFSMNTPDCQTWSCDHPPETMTAPQHHLNKLKCSRKEKERKENRTIGQVVKEETSK